MRTLIQHHKSTSGSRPRIVRKPGEKFVVNSGPERALKIPKADSGKTIDLRSFLVKSRTVCKWYWIERDSDATS